MSHRREDLAPPRPVVASSWGAQTYRLSGGLGPAYIEAARGATWERGAPLASYRPAGKRREVEAGPHLTFLRLKAVLDKSDTGVFDRALLVFARSFGLLGLFDEAFSPPRPSNEIKSWVAPEAVIGADGRLRSVDPATEGMELLLDLLQQRGQFANERRRETARAHGVALPDELVCTRKPRLGFWGPGSVPWGEARREYDALLVLDEESAGGVSVLSRREPYDAWRMELENFPDPDLTDKRTLRAYLNERVREGVAPFSPEGEDGQGYRCVTLLKSLYLLFWLDVTGGGSIRRCASRRCPNYFRMGSQPTAIYCLDPRCASRESSRRYEERKKKARRSKAT